MNLRIRFVSAPGFFVRAPRVAEDPMTVTFESSCVVPDDDSCIVRHARPLDEQARRQIREQQIARLRRDEAAVAARERRIAIESSGGKVVQMRTGMSVQR
jgi:hypothetical protein